MTNKKAVLLHDLLLVVLAVASVGFLLYEETHAVSAARRFDLALADFVIALIFLADFLWDLWHAPDKKKYWREHWYELLASIPFESPVFEALRGLRVLRIVQVVRIIRASTHLHRVTQSLFTDLTLRLVTLALTATTIILSGAVEFYHFEYGVNPMVRTFFDSFWWAMGTVTTVIYGDIYPVTTEGRIIAIIMSLVGVATLSTVVGTVTEYILKRKHSLI